MSETKVASGGNIYTTGQVQVRTVRYSNNSNSNERVRGNAAPELEGKLEVGAKRRTVACRCVSVTLSPDLSTQARIGTAKCRLRRRKRNKGTFVVSTLVLAVVGVVLL